MLEIQQLFFSRNKEIWPFLSDPGAQDILKFRQHHIPAEDILDSYPTGNQLSEELNNLDKISESWSSPVDNIDPLMIFTAATSKNWENPASVENVVSAPCDPAIYGAYLASIANPNLVYSEYAGTMEEMERAVIRQISGLVGYDQDLSTGVFTQGGTFCNMYGYLFGIRKSLPESLHLGLEYGQDYRIINSQGGHYSNTTNLSVLGVNIDKKTIRIKLTEDNDIDMHDLEDQLSSCFKLNCVVPTIMLTMGTTDTFGVDRVKPVSDLCDRLCKQFQIEVRPHIHVDAAVGWPLIFFIDYDFQSNPLEINQCTLEGLERNVARFRELKYADSFTVDFQKWGYVPYTSSLVMVKDRASMDALQHDPENFSYFENDVQGQTHLQSTIECSRGATGVLGAYSAMHYMGIKGYQTLIAHGLQNANYFKMKLREIPGAKIMAPNNQGPSVGFRLYDTRIVKDIDAEFTYEVALNDCPEYRERVKANSAYHRAIFKRRKKKHLYTNWIEFVTHTDYDPFGRWDKLPGEKAVFLNALTMRENIDAFMEDLKQTILAHQSELTD